MNTRTLAALAAAFLLSQSLIGQAQAQFIPPPPPITPPVVIPVPVLPPIVTGTAMIATVKAGSAFSDGNYQTVGTVNWPKATVQAGTTLSFTLGDMFSLPDSQTLESCALTTTASAQLLNGNAYTGSYTISGVSSAIVAVSGAGTHARKASGSAVANASGVGSKSSTISFNLVTPGTYLLSANLGTLNNDIACPWGTFTSSVTNAATAATAVIQVVSTSDYAQPETGWYWEPSQGGRGVAIEYFPATGNIFLGIFGYGTSGESSWLVGVCAYDAGTQTCAGNLNAHRGGVTLAQTEGPIALYDGSPGRFTLTFTERSKLTLTWIGQPLNLVRYGLTGATSDPAKVAGSFPGGAAIQTGWYWNSSTGGRGWFVETARKPDGTMVTFVVGFMYRTDGTPVWYALEASTAARTVPALFEGAMMQEFTGGPSMTAPSWSANIQHSERGAGAIAVGNGTLAISFMAGQVNLTKFTQ